jgi:hypothetical protein
VEQRSGADITPDFTDEHPPRLLFPFNLQSNKPGGSCPGYNPLQPGSITLQGKRLYAVAKKMSWGDTLAT